MARKKWIGWGLLLVSALAFVDPNGFAGDRALHGPASAPSGSARFAVIGDYGQAGPAAEAVAWRVRSGNPDFIVTTGDNNSSSTAIPASPTGSPQTPAKPAGWRSGCGPPTRHGTSW
jgi:hypothetical protein